MKRSEAISKFYDTIRAEMIEDYRIVISHEGSVQYDIYVWEDGEIETMQQPQGGTGWLQPRSGEPRELFFVTTIGEDASFSIWDCSDDGEPEDEDEREEMREQIIDWMMERYEETIDERLDEIISDAEYDERNGYDN